MWKHFNPRASASPLFDAWRWRSGKTSSGGNSPAMLDHAVLERLLHGDLSAALPGEGVESGDHL